MVYHQLRDRESGGKSVLQINFATAKLGGNRKVRPLILALGLAKKIVVSKNIAEDDGPSIGIF